MGGDHAPGEIVRGAVLAANKFDVDIVLVGKSGEISALLEENKRGKTKRIEVADAPGVIHMSDDPTAVIRDKKDSSMVVALDMLKDGEGDAIVSAGSTGALLAGATIIVKRIEGIRRAAMAPVLPTAKGGAVLIDCGANVECTSELLLQFAYLGAYYAKLVLGIKSPRVGLLNNGTEETKGMQLQKESYKLLQRAHETGKINFVGNIEGSAVPAGAADVIVTDGFTGNILLKTYEGVGSFLMKEFKKILTKSPVAKISGMMIRKNLKNLRRRMDAGDVGGAPFLGISKPVIKAHGSSTAPAICSAIGQAAAFIESSFIEKVTEDIEYMK